MTNTIREVRPHLHVVFTVQQQQSAARDWMRRHTMHSHPLKHRMNEQ